MHVVREGRVGESVRDRATRKDLLPAKEVRLQPACLQDYLHA